MISNRTGFFVLLLTGRDFLHYTDSPISGVFETGQTVSYLGMYIHNRLMERSQ